MATYLWPGASVACGRGQGEAALHRVRPGYDTDIDASTSRMTLGCVIDGTQLSVREERCGLLRRSGLRPGLSGRLLLGRWALRAWWIQGKREMGSAQSGYFSFFFVCIFHLFLFPFL